MIIEIIGLLFSIILGTIGHFVYDLTNKNKLIGFFFATNESIWQHLKLGITPIILWTIIELLTFNFNNLFFAKFISIISFILILLTLYFSYKIICKKNILFLDILIFYISLAIAYYVSIKILTNINNSFIINFIGLIGMVFTLFCYKLFNKY